MKNQHQIATEVAQTLDVKTLSEAQKLQELVGNLWSATDASWRNGDKRYSREIVNSLASLSNACRVKVEELTPKDAIDFEALMNGANE